MHHPDLVRRRPRALPAAGTPVLALVLVMALALALSACGSDRRAEDADDEPGARASYDTTALTSGADWLAGQVEDGVVHNDQYDMDDLGLSVDVALALDQVEQHDDVVGAVTDQLADGVDGYVAPGYGTLTSAGSTAKAVVLAEAAGEDPTHFGGTDLVARLESTVVADGPGRGRIRDELDPKEKKATDYANVVGQAYAVEGLEGADSARAADAIGYLLQQQCRDGWFRLSFAADPTAPDQGCDADGDSAPDIDATAFAVRALEESDDSDAADAADRAIAWLRDVQAEDGSFGGAPVGHGANSNSTALAGAVLGEAGETTAAQRAAGWVAAHQVPACPGTDTTAVGAIAYDDAALATATRQGITVKTQDQTRRATAQGLPSLAWLPVAATPGDGAC